MAIVLTRLKLVSSFWEITLKKTIDNQDKLIIKAITLVKVYAPPTSTEISNSLALDYSA